jgi:hypothetical protein
MIGVANAIDAACGEWLETHDEALNLGRFWQGVQPDRCRIFDAASREKNPRHMGLHPRSTRKGIRYGYSLRGGSQ